MFELYTKSNQNSDLALGHGGCGAGNFVFAIIAWGNGMSDSPTPIVCGFDINDIADNWTKFIANVASIIL